MPYKVADVELLILPGASDPDPDHWHARWARSLKTARRIEHATPAGRVARILAEVEAARRRAVLVAHGRGVAEVAQAAPLLDRHRVAGAFLVAPLDLDSTGQPPLPGAPLPFPSVVIASRNDPFVAFARAGALAQAWGAAFTDAGEAGHIDAASGHGPWPEGLMRLGAFLKGLG